MYPTIYYPRRNVWNRGVPTLTSNVLYCFFSVIGHDRRKIVHFNVTRAPTTVRFGLSSNREKHADLRQAFASPRLTMNR